VLQGRRRHDGAMGIPVARTGLTNTDFIIFIGIPEKKDKSNPSNIVIICPTLWLFNIAMENGP
jgi:methionine synthase I (cobalamin-dependent)